MWVGKVWTFLFVTLEIYTLGIYMHFSGNFFETSRQHINNPFPVFREN